MISAHGGQYEAQSCFGTFRGRWTYRLCAVSSRMRIRGDSESEALQNIREAIELYLEPVDDDLAGIGKDVREIVL
jgi:hypothetical protein